MPDEFVTELGRDSTLQLLDRIGRELDHLAGIDVDQVVVMLLVGVLVTRDAVLEGMASALPVVTTDAGGMREAVRDGIDGVVVPVRDSDAAGSALAWLAAEPEVRTRMGASGRARIEADFRLADQITAFDGLLHEAAGR